MLSSDSAHLHTPSTLRVIQTVKFQTSDAVKDSTMYVYSPSRQYKILTKTDVRRD